MIIRLQHQRADGNVDTYHLKPGRRYHIGRGSACEVRILDFKLSRKHCVLEFFDGHWQIVDLASTNGCRVDDEQIVGARRLSAGQVIALGQSSLRVARIHAVDVSGDDDDGGETETEAEIDADTGKLTKSANTPHATERSPVPPPRRQLDESAESHPAAMDLQMAIEPMPLDSDSGDSRPASSRLMIDNVPSHYPQWEPEPGTDFLNKTDVLMPKEPIPAAAVLLPAAGPHVGQGETGAIIRPPRREGSGLSSHQRTAARIVPVVIQADNVAGDDSAGNPAVSLNAFNDSAPAPEPEALAETQPTVAPHRQAATASTARSATAADDDRSFFITVLGRRIGPLTRAVARELKVRELKGSLTPKDLEPYSG